MSLLGFQHLNVLLMKKCNFDDKLPLKIGNIPIKILRLTFNDYLSIFSTFLIFFLIINSKNLEFFLINHLHLKKCKIPLQNS